MSDLLNKASLVMIPSGYKEDTVFSQIPQDGSGDLSFTRASNGTRVNSAGLVEVCPWNLLQYSEDFTNAVWTKKSTISLTANATTAPNGTNTATKMYANTSGTVDYGCFQILTSQSATLSVYAKKSELNYLYIGFNNDFASEGVFFNLNTGAISQNTGGYTASIESVGNGWYRCIAYFPTISLCFISPSVSGTSFVFSNENNNGIYIWGAQLNIGATAKPYFPTTDRLNVPRLTYQNGGGGCPSLLLEKQSTNLFTYSEDYTNANWTKNNCSITANATTSPDGTQNADKFVEDTTNSIHRISHTSTATNPTVSIYAKAGERSKVAIFTPPIDIAFDLSNGTIINLGYGTTGASIESVGNGWYRISLQFTASNPTVYFGTILSSTQVSYTGDGTSGAYFWGAQIEDSAYKTSYIPTQASSATRVADACYKTGISSLIGQSEGVIFYDGVLTGISNAFANLINSEKNTTGSFSIGQRSTGAILCGFFVGGSSVINFNAGSYAVGTRTKIAFAYKSGSSVLYVNGTQLATSTATFTPIENIDDIYIGDPTTFFNYKENTQVNQVAIFPTRLTNAELASITSL